MSSPSPRRMVATGQVTIGTIRYELRFSVPEQPVPLEEMLPLYRGLTDMMTQQAQADAAASGKPCTCARGCDACCHQLVPLAQTEARALAQVIEQLPEPVRTAVSARFEDARNKVIEAGLMERVEALPSLSRTERIQLGFEYSRHRIACPFLIEGVCAAYEQRPLRCREHMVSSQPQHCETPDQGHVHPILTRVSISRALQIVESDDSAQATGFIALVCAREWAQRNPNDSSPTSGVSHVQRLLNLLGGGSSAPTERVSEPK